MDTKVDLQKYRKCLLEIKRRTELISLYLKGKQKTGYPITDIEFLCLQFRKVIELIALSSLVVNKDEYSKQHAKFATDWNARLIFQDLERINPKFYPVPTIQVQTEDRFGGKHYQIEPLKDGFLTREDAVDVYTKCGGILHAENPFGQEKELNAIKSQFKEWLNKIIKLLNHHCIFLSEIDYMVIGILREAKTNAPNAYFFERVEIDQIETNQ